MFSLLQNSFSFSCYDANKTVCKTALNTKFFLFGFFCIQLEYRRLQARHLQVIAETATQIQENTESRNYHI